MASALLKICSIGVASASAPPDRCGRSSADTSGWQRRTRLTGPSLAPSGLAYTEHVLAALLDRGLKPATAFSMHLILFSYIGGFATSLEMEATAEADTGVTADEWMDVQKPALEALLADQDLPAFRTVLDSFEPRGYDMDVNELFEAGLSYLLAGFRRAH
jgi:hypothetical protein